MLKLLEVDLNLCLLHNIEGCCLLCSKGVANSISVPCTPTLLQIMIVIYKNFNHRIFGIDVHYLNRFPKKSIYRRPVCATEIGRVPRGAAIESPLAFLMAHIKLDLLAPLEASFSPAIIVYLYSIHRALKSNSHKRFCTR